jgi:signal transduction histidine kinase
MVALPLQTRNRVIGAAAFYFAEAVELNTGEHGLLRTVVDQMAAAVEKAALIEELRRANAALIESRAELERQHVASLAARRLKDEFVATMSHELRTPLTAVLGYVGLLQEGLSGPLTDAQQRTLTHVAAAGERLLSLIDDVLELAALKRGDVPIRLEEFDPGDALCEAVAAATGRAPGVALRVAVPDALLPLMRSDRKKVVRILTHLLNNAYKFTSAGEVSASVEVHDGMAYFSIRDTGMGIAPDARRIIFEEFRQADGSRTRRHGGSGVGLALSRRLALLLGGDIRFHSAPNEGSSFVVELPLECAAEADCVPLAVV